MDSAAQARSEMDLAGSKIGRFTIGQRLGAGGMGEVYRAEDNELQRAVAIKRVRPDVARPLASRRELLKEARRACSLNHPHIATVHDVFTENDELFLVMEYVDGQTLAECIGRGMSLSEFGSVASQCLEAVVAAHENGVLHGDLKPANIMLTQKKHVKICDFGLARRVSLAADGSESTTRAEFAGTPAYMAPEALTQQPAALAADIFSLGVVFYEMLSGGNPFIGHGMVETLDRIRNLHPKPLTEINPRVPRSLERLVTSMLMKNPAQRASSAADLLSTLNKIQASFGTETNHRAQMKRVGGKEPSDAPLSRRHSPKSREAGEIAAGCHLAVLPFTLIGADRDRQVFVDGLTETLNSHLSKLTVARGLQVATARETHRLGVTTPEEARQQFGATVALSASIQFAADALRVNCALIDTKTGKAMRAETVTAELDDSFVVQDRIVNAVIKMIGIELRPAERALLAGHGTQEPGAYEFYLQGRGYLQDFDRLENLDNAITVFRRALEIDPRYALAYAGMGEAYWRKFELTKAVEWVGLARGACEGAVVIDPSLAEPHGCLGMVLNGQGEHEKATVEFILALELDSTNDAFYVGLATAYEKLKRPEKAEQTYRRGIEARPQYWAAHNALGVYLANAGRFDEAIDCFKRVVALAPDNFRGYRNLGAVQFLTDRVAEAITTFEKSLAIRPNYEAASNLGTLYYFEGQYSSAAGALRQALSLNQSDHKVWGYLGMVLREAKEPEESASAFRRAAELADKALHVNPRDSLSQMRLAEYTAALGHLEQAITIVQKVIEAKPTDPNTLLNLAVFFEVEMKDRAQAHYWLSEAVEHGQTWREIDRAPELAGLREDPAFLELRSR